MHRHRCHICTCCHSRNRKASSKIKMRSMCLICQAKHSCIMSHLDDRTQITAYSVISRIIYQHRNCFWMFFYRFLYLFPFHSKGNSEPLIYLRVYINRNRTAQNKCIQNTPVNITRQYDLISTFAGSQDHRLNGTCRASYHQECMCCSKSICCQFFCLPYYRYRMAEIIQWLHTVNIDTYTFLSQKFCQFRIASSAFMTRYIKWYNPHTTESLQSFMYRCMILV